MFTKFHRYSNMSSEEWIALTHLCAEVDDLTKDNYREFMDKLDDVDYIRILEVFSRDRERLKKENELLLAKQCLEA